MARDSADAPLAIVPPRCRRRARKRTWQEAVVRYLALKAESRSIEDSRRICRKLHGLPGNLTLDRIAGDVVCRVIEAKLAEGRRTATVDRYLAVMRCLLRTGSQ